MTITLDRAVELIEAKRKAEKERHIKTYAEDDKLELLKGRFGPYIAYDGKNYHIDKKLHERALAATSLTRSAWTSSRMLPNRSHAEEGKVDG